MKEKIQFRKNQEINQRDSQIASRVGQKYPNYITQERQVSLTRP